MTLVVISRTPFRISFFGGGTDYPTWYENNSGAVLAITIDKYCYISCRYLPPFFEHKYRIVYSKIESVKNVSEIEHPAVRAILEFKGIKGGVEIHHDGDLPARTGLGSSSAFTVGLLHAVHALKGSMPSKQVLASEAIHIERGVLKEYVGSQDQVLAAYGGFNKIDFNPDHTFRVNPVTLSKDKVQELQDHLMFYFTGFSRNASEIVKKQIELTSRNESKLSAMHQMVDEALNILSSDSRSILDFGKLLHEGWELKRNLTDKISTAYIDDIYNAARSAGVIGGKLIGAGGGGFMVFFARPEEQSKIKAKLRGLLQVPFKFETYGSQIIFYEPNLSS